MGEIAELQQHRLGAHEITQRYLALQSDPRFIDFAGAIEINEYGELLVNAANRYHVLLQKRLAAYLERSLGGEAVTEMPVRVTLPDGAGFKLRVPDISWSLRPDFFEGPADKLVLTQPAELCVEIKSDANTLRELREKAGELLRGGATEVWIVFPDLKQIDYYASQGRLAVSRFDVDLEAFWRANEVR